MQFIVSVVILVLMLFYVLRWWRVHSDPFAFDPLSADPSVVRLSTLSVGPWSLFADATSLTFKHVTTGAQRTMFANGSETTSTSPTLSQEATETVYLVGSWVIRGFDRLLVIHPSGRPTDNVFALELDDAKVVVHKQVPWSTLPQLKKGTQPSEIRQVQLRSESVGQDWTLESNEHALSFDVICPNKKDAFVISSGGTSMWFLNNTRLGRLGPGAVLRVGEELKSQDMQTRLALTPEKLILTTKSKVVWERDASSGTQQNLARLTCTEDGNVVLESTSGATVWETGTVWSTEPSVRLKWQQRDPPIYKDEPKELRVTNQGTMYIVGLSTGNVWWDSSTDK